MIADNPRFPTLTLFDACHLLGFPMKLLNLPAIATHLLCRRCVILSPIVSHDVICDDYIAALGGQNNPEQFDFGLWESL